MNLKNSQWITTARDLGDVCPVFRKRFIAEKEILSAALEITALGVYEAELNGRRVGDFVLAPGWTSYDHRLQVQTYDVTELLRKENELRVTLGRGWFRSPMPGFVDSEDKQHRYDQPCGLIARLEVHFADGSESVLSSDESWEFAESPVRFSEIYDGERYDAAFAPKDWEAARLLNWTKEILIPQEGEEIRETERVAARAVLHTPAGETVIDFGQEVTGYVEFAVTAREGDEVRFTHGEMLDAEGNFYNANYRSARAEVLFRCREGNQIWHPRLTFFGFRYIKLLSWPGEVKVEDFTAVVVHSDMKRTGWLESGDAMLNQLFSNIVWGQRGNFLDVPTDCPQRDERLGWTGDAQVFVRTASYLYDVERFFRKWLRDLAADQRESGEVGEVIPDMLPTYPGSAAWGDAAVICPWTIYQTYGDRSVLDEQFESMKKWVDYISGEGWEKHFHFGDWLGLDAPSGSYKGSTRDGFIAAAFRLHAIELLGKAGRLLGREVHAYQDSYMAFIERFRKDYPDYRTQTEHVLAIHFGLAEDPQKTADALADLVRDDGKQLRTGFVGTPYLLHALSDYGHADLAWDLLLRKTYPGWLYSVTKGATTIWEHWDGAKEDGSFWSTDMNSFNHYAYGAVADWIFEKAAGIRHEENAPGFAALVYEPHPDPRIGFLKAELETRHGTIRASWRYEDTGIRYELETPVPALVRLGGEDRYVMSGSYTFWSIHSIPEKEHTIGFSERSS
ncbi:family 78 glycoside hydrolase catalytic domain [Bilifractor sp. LCP21S3_A7]|uniref:alpha-L-rhamnosidase n=1 Tax=Bilifractor sp. LCP21S3_A7 TaxID=3438738 RepID=UPI003F8FCBB6